MTSTRARTLAALGAAALLIPVWLAPSVAHADVDLDGEEIAAVQALNDARVAMGLAPFTVSPVLTEIAEWMADDQARRDGLDHTDRLGRDIRERNDAFGYPSNSAIRENLAAGNATGEATMQQWMDSPGHYANNMAANVRTVGIARVRAQQGSYYGWFWVLEFGSVEDPGTVTLDGVNGGDDEPPPDPPIGAGAGTFVSDFPDSGIGLNVWNGGSVALLAAGVAQGGGDAVFVAIAGELTGYIVGAPAFVNAEFNAAFPDDVPAGTVVVVVV